MKKRVVIASIYSGEAIKSSIVKLSPTGLILIVEKDLDNLKGDDGKIKRAAIEDLQKNFGRILEISFIRVNNIYDVYEVTKEIVKTVDEIKDSEIFFNISEGRKPISFAMSYASYLRKDKIQAVYYLVKETDSLLKLPFLNFFVNKTQKEILKEVAKKPFKISSLKEGINKSKSVFYKYLKELANNGFILIEEDMVNITDLGKMVIL